MLINAPGADAAGLRQVMVLDPFSTIARVALIDTGSPFSLTHNQDFDMASPTFLAHIPLPPGSLPRIRVASL